MKIITIYSSVEGLRFDDTCISSDLVDVLLHNRLALGPLQLKPQSWEKLIFTSNAIQTRY